MKKIKNTLPSSMKKYFWDCDFSELNYEKYPVFVTERLLNFGDQGAVDWLLERINKKQLKQLVNTSRKLDKKTKNYWQIMLNEY